MRQKSFVGRIAIMVITLATFSGFTSLIAAEADGKAVELKSQTKSGAVEIYTENTEAEVHEDRTGENPTADLLEVSNGGLLLEDNLLGSVQCSSSGSASTAILGGCYPCNNNKDCDACCFDGGTCGLGQVCNCH